MTKLVRLRNIAVGLIASTCALSFMMHPALATSPKITVAGVRTNNNFKGYGAATTFVSPPPPFEDFSQYQLQPAIRPQYPSVGVNFPSRASGILPAIGSFEELVYFYQVPDLGPSADAGLRYFVQTSDGFLHTASSASTLGVSAQGVNVYEVVVQSFQFSPVLVSQTVNTLNIRYASNSSAGTIYIMVFSTSIVGSDNVIDIFNVNTLNDNAFNN